MPIDTRREQRHIWREYRRFFRQIGEKVIWFQFDTGASSYDDIYDEGGKDYRPGIHVPALWVDQIEDPEQYSGEGRRPTQRIRFAVSSMALALRGISPYEAHGNELGSARPSAPLPPQVGRPSSPWLDDRLNDVIYYDQRFYSLSQFQIRGRLRSQDVIIGVAGIELIPEDESVFDFFPYGNQICDVQDDESGASALDIWVRHSSPRTVTLDFDFTLEGTWSAIAENSEGTSEIPVTVSGDEIELDLSGFDSGFPWTWKLFQRTPSNQRITVYYGNIYEVVEVVDDDDDTEWLDIYIEDDDLPSTFTVEFRDPETNQLMDDLSGEWDAYIELASGTWGVPLVDNDDGTIDLDFTEFEAQLPATWWLVQTAPTGQVFKVHEGNVYLVEQE